MRHWLVLLLFSSVLGFAQKNKNTPALKRSNEIFAKASVKKGEIILRWIPADQQFWKLGNQYGYKVERISFDSYMDNTADSATYKNATTLTTQASKPWGESDTAWASLIRKNKNAAFVYQALYNNANTKNKNVEQKAKTDEMNFGFVLKGCDLSTDLAKAHGLYIKDNSFDKNEVYVYRIMLYNAPKTIKYSPAVIAVNPKELNVLPTLGKVKGSFGNRIVKLNFEAAKYIEDFAGYVLERSEDSINYMRTAAAPFIFATSQYEKNKTELNITDSLPQNNKVYFYRVRGLSYFGELSEPSNALRGKGKSDGVVGPIIDSTSVKENKKATLYFKMPEGFDKSELKGFAISRADKVNGNYKTITNTLLTVSSTTFTDDTPLFTNYYKVAAITKNNDTAYSYAALVQLDDREPPAAPTALKGSIDSLGRVTLTWEANKEKDLKGYRVFRVNSLSEQYIEITNVILTKPEFKDSITLHTLTKNVYYSIRAVDKVFNNSDYSQPVLLKRPDKIAPVKPIFIKAVHTDTSIVLQWIPSSSDDADCYALYRTSNDDKTLRNIKEWAAKDTLRTYTDTNIVFGKSYTYTLQVLDDSKNKAISVSPTVMYEPSFRKKIKDIKATVDREARKITLNWNYPAADIYNYTIYKCKKGEQLRSFKTIGPNATSLEDKELYPDNTYIYKIKATFNSGTESMLSDAVEVIF